MKSDIKILNIVSSNIVNDPRVTRAYRMAKNNDEKMKVIGRSFNKDNKNEDFIFINVQKNNDIIIFKIFERLKFMSKIVQYGLKQEFDIIHANDFDMLIPGLILKKIKKKPLVYDAHEIYAENALFSKSFFLKKLSIFIEKNTLKNVDTFISVSNAAAKYYQEKYSILPIVISNMPYPINNKLKKAEKFTVLSHGIFVPDRGYEELVLLNNELNHNNIGIILRGYGEYKDQLEKLSAPEKLDGLFQPSVPVDEVVKYASSAHLGVVLTKNVSLNYKLSISNKIFEYINAGLPVIMSDLPEHRYLNEKYHFGIILKNISKESLKEEILNLYNNRKKYKILQENAINASKILNWEVEGEKLLEIYKTLSNT